MYISISSILGSRIFRNDSHQNSYRRHAPQQQHCSNNGNSGSDDCTRSSSIEQGWWAIFNFRIISRCCGKAMKILVSFHPSCRSHKWFVDFIPGSRQVIDSTLVFDTSWITYQEGDSRLLEKGESRLWLNHKRQQTIAIGVNSREYDGGWWHSRSTWTNM